jgi:hypothetical protein
MNKSKAYRGGRGIDHTAFFFIVSAHQQPEWFLVLMKFGHLGIVLIIAICQHMCRSKHFLLKMDAKFYATLGRDYNISKEQCDEVLLYLLTETELYDKYLFDNGFLFRDRKHSAQDILDAINKYRPDQPPLMLEDELERLMDSDENDTNDSEENYPE